MESFGRVHRRDRFADNRVVFWISVQEKYFAVTCCMKRLTSAISSELFRRADCENLRVCQRGAFKGYELPNFVDKDEGTGF